MGLFKFNTQTEQKARALDLTQIMSRNKLRSL